MKFNEAWLRTFCDPDVSTTTLVEQLTMAGLEVDSVAPAAPAFSGVLIGEVQSVRPHPNADKLRLCEVTVGGTEPLSIVCGASNVRPGLRVPVATIGAVLPGEFKIKQSKLRGEASFGMLCSEHELGLADSAQGLMELPGDAPIGRCIRDYLALDDAIIEVDLTPNRADCLSVEGIAREVGLLNRSSFTKVAPADIAVEMDETLAVEVAASAACPRYLGRLIRNVDVHAITPQWMQERLRRAGLRCLSPLVDVTNYVLLELGQPLHAFDANKLNGGIHVRFAQAGENLTLLNDQTIELLDDVLVIADQAKPIALAGIMGGAETAVDDDTRDVFLECAFFTPDSIMGKARRYGLHTDSSHRFERGVDPDLQDRAIQRASELIVAICGGDVGPVVDQTRTDAVPKKQVIELRQDRVKRLLGIELDPSEITDMLQRLEMAVQPSGKGWLVTPPSFRFDVAIEADLIEEIARVYGYDRLPQNRMQMPSQVRGDREYLISVNRFKDVLVDLGYQEAICYSFVDEATQSLVNPDQAAYTLKNPISSDLSVMRTTLWVGLLNAVNNNIKRNQQAIRFFESGLKFIPTSDGLIQEPVIAGVLTGHALAEQWAMQTRGVDFYDLKSDVENLLRLSGTPDTYRFVPAKHPALHPGQAAQILDSNGKPIGLLGLLHPALEKQLDLEQPVYLFEIRLEPIQQRAIPQYSEMSKFQAVRRDIALIVDETLAVQSLVNYISEHGELIRDVIVFDVYQGQGVENGRKSIALGLILQDYSKTLVDQEIEEILHQLMNGLAETFGARLRD